MASFGLNILIPVVEDPHFCGPSLDALQDAMKAIESRLRVICGQFHTQAPTLPDTTRALLYALMSKTLKLWETEGAPSAAAAARDILTAWDASADLEKELVLGMGGKVGKKTKLPVAEEVKRGRRMMEIVEGYARKAHM